MYWYTKSHKSPLEPISYRGALLSTLLHVTVYKFIHNSLNVLVQIANKMELQKGKHESSGECSYVLGMVMSVLVSRHVCSS
jgi:hypothetical protein